MNILKYFTSDKVNFQDNLYHSQFKGYFKNRKKAYDELKKYESINSFKTLLHYLHQKYPIGVIPHYDYPFLFHFNYISKKINKKVIVNDYGGSFGPHFNALTKYNTNKVKEWNIYEEESIVDDLKQLNLSIGGHNSKLNFFKTNDLIKNCDIVYACGSIQYYDFDTPLELLNKIPQKPRFVIFNLFPIDSKIKYNIYTLQNVFNQIVVNTIFSENKFINEMSSYGYKLKDQWKDYSANCNILNSDYNLPFYSGQFYELIS